MNGAYRALFPPDRHLSKLTDIDFRRGITFTLSVPLGRPVINRLSPVRLLLTLRASSPTPALTRVVLNEPRITRACSTSVLNKALMRKTIVTVMRISGVSSASAYLTICLMIPFRLPLCGPEIICSLGWEEDRRPARGWPEVGVVPD